MAIQHRKNGWENYVVAWRSAQLGIDDENQIHKAELMEQKKWRE